MPPLFTVDIRGLQQTLVQDAPRILMEPIANALDTTATDILVRFSWARGIATYTVEDNDPRGFERLADAFTLFAPSQRKADPTARGRFGYGEKEFVALCYPGPVAISTTSGTVTFDRDTRTVQTGANARREIGSAVEARIRLSRDEADAFVARLRSLLVPDGITLTLELNGDRVILAPRPILRQIEKVDLPTVLADADGVLRPSRRQTTLTLHEVRPGESPTLHELGVPVVAHAGAWHIDVHQKVPLARSRDAVTPAYLRAVHAAALDAAADMLSADTARAPWVMSALAQAQPETVRTIVHTVYGENAVIADPSCPEATKRAVDVCRTVVYGGAFPGDVWETIKEHGILRRAGHYPELRRDVATSPDGIPPIPELKWKPGWRHVAQYAATLGLELTGRDITVSLYRLPHGDHAATCGPGGELTLNVANLGRSWWTNEQAIDELLIHEFAHLKVLDHLSDAFHKECCRLGAGLRNCETRLAAFSQGVEAA